MADRLDQSKISPVPFSGCFLWTGTVSRAGYGQIQIGKKRFYAHRVSYEDAKGEIPLGMCVLHACDTPACVNPAHLSIGTKRDNTHDMMRKQRDRFTGERNPGVKLTSFQVAQIRERTESCVKAAKRYGVSRATITAIRRGTTRVNG
jgi:hypothetical protein